MKDITLLQRALLSTGNIRACDDQRREVVIQAKDSATIEWKIQKPCIITEIKFHNINDVKYNIVLEKCYVGHCLALDRNFNYNELERKGILAPPGVIASITLSNLSVIKKTVDVELICKLYTSEVAK